MRIVASFTEQILHFFTYLHDVLSSSYVFLFVVADYS